MRKKQAIINIYFALLLQIVTVVSGFVVPKLIIESFGSDTNGLLNSIASFIAYITLLQSGVGGVIRASLYKPLAKKDHESLCIILNTTERFFRKIAYATVVYIGILVFAFPLIITKQFNFTYTASLVIIIGISTAAQYFFGITYQMLLEADQKSYIYSMIQIVTVILNTIFTVVLIKVGCNIQIVKLFSSIFFVLRPIVINAYTRRKYKIDINVAIDDSVIAQRWDGVAQAIAYFVHSKTDIFVLTIFSSLSNISIYSVYALVTTGLTALIECIDKAVRAAFGNIIANDEKVTLQKSFNSYNYFIHILSSVCFSTAIITVFQFVNVYTKGVTDADYQNITFGILILVAEGVYCLRMPYNAIITSAGKYKETKKSAYVEASLNIIISCILVRKYGLVGVAIGTLTAMVYRTISFTHFLHSNILYLDYFIQAKRYIVTALSSVVAIYLLGKIQYTAAGYMQWCGYACCIFVLDCIIVFGINIIFDKKQTVFAINTFMGRRRKQT